MCEGNQGAILLEKNRQVGMRTNHIGIHHHFLRNVLEDKYIEEKPADIMMKTVSEADYIKHMKRIMEGELWELV